MRDFRNTVTVHSMYYVDIFCAGNINSSRCICVYGLYPCSHEQLVSIKLCCDKRKEELSCKSIADSEGKYGYYINEF